MTNVLGSDSLLSISQTIGVLRPEEKRFTGGVSYGCNPAYSITALVIFCVLIAVKYGMQ